MAEHWHRIHRLSPEHTAASRVLSSPCDYSWVATIDAPLWRKTHLLETLEAAQGWADRILCSMHPHDCHNECTDWNVGRYDFGETKSVN